MNTRLLPAASAIGVRGGAGSMKYLCFLCGQSGGNENAHQPNIGIVVSVTFESAMLSAPGESVQGQLSALRQGASCASQLAAQVGEDFCAFGNPRIDAFKGLPTSAGRNIRGKWGNCEN